MDQSAEHLREISNTLYKYHLDNFLCDVFVVTTDGREVPAHSVVLSTVSIKLRAAFEKSDNSVKKNYIFKLYVSDCDAPTVEIVLQFVYTGAINLPHDMPFDVTRILSAGQKLGLDSSKLASCLSALLCLADASVMENLPPVILTDEDLCLEIVEKGVVAVGATAKSNGKTATLRGGSSEFIRITSRERSKKAPVGRLDHSYTHHGTNVADGVASSSSGTTSGSVNCEAVISSNSVHSVISDDFSGCASTTSSLMIDATACKADGSGDELTDLPTAYVVKTEAVEGSSAIVSIEQLTEEAARSCLSQGEETVSQKGRSGFAGGRREKVIHICDCGRSFLKSKEFSEHRRTHTGERPYKCDICGKSFPRTRSLIEHRRTHTGERPYVCDICARQFLTSGELVKHSRLHSGEKPYHCQICGKDFFRCGEFADHRRVHAGENACPICGKEFTRLHNMKEHMNSAHTGMKHYTCTTCGKQFAYSSGLRYHRRLHKADRPFKCDLCGKCFARMGELNRHERSAHKVVEIQLQL